MYLSNQYIFTESNDCFHIMQGETAFFMDYMSFDYQFMDAPCVAATILFLWLARGHAQGLPYVLKVQYIPVQSLLHLSFSLIILTPVLQPASMLNSGREESRIVLGMNLVFFVCSNWY